LPSGSVPTTWPLIAPVVATGVPNVAPIVGGCTTAIDGVSFSD